MRVSTFTQNTRIDANIQNLQREIATAQRQISTGKKADVFSGLGGGDARALIELRSELSRRDEYMNAIRTSNLRMRAMEAALTGIQDVLSSFRADLFEQGGAPSEAAAPHLQTIAKSAFSRVTDLLNTAIDGRYLFNGYDTSTKPVIDSETVLGNFATAFGAPEGGGLANIIAAADDTYDGLTTTGFFEYQTNYLAAEQTSGETFKTKISDAVQVDYGELASDSSFTQALNVFAVFSNYDFDSVNKAEFQDLLNWGRDQIEASFDGVNVMVGSLGVHRQTMERQSIEHENFSGIIQDQIVDMEDVDKAEAITRFQTLQTQLETSYQVTALVRKLSLSNFI